MSVVSNNILAGSSGQGGAAAYEIERSLRFNSADTPKLTRTPSSASNQKTWTLSFWMKRTTTGSREQILSAAGTHNTYVEFQNDKLMIEDHNPGLNFILKTTRVFRDPSSWYSVIFSVDTTQATASNRIKLYINGVQETAFDSATYPSQNYDTSFNDTGEHKFGQFPGNTTFPFNGYLADVHFIDGQALAPTDFGETDSNGVWQAKEYTGSYGTNGFHLPFSDNSANAQLGLDYSQGNPGTNNKGMEVVTYTGNGTSQSISNLSFQPDFIWTKRRSTAGSHGFFDSVRGATKWIGSNSTSSEQVYSDSLTSFDSNGFSVGADSAWGGLNVNGTTNVAWCWKAGGTPSTNTDGTITSSVSVNNTYGFSICSYTGNGTSGASVGHGLNSAPKWIVIKSRNRADNWRVYHSGIGETKSLFLSTTGASDTSSVYWNNTAPTNSVFSLGTDSGVNTNSDPVIAYCWSEVSGFSKFGSYSGNGSTTGPVVTTGFKPRYILIKADIAGEDWVILDTARDTGNPVDQIFFANTADAELTNSAYNVEIKADGFQIKNTNPRFNTNGSTYYYSAFADNPGNDWTVNNLVATAGLETSNQGFDCRSDLTAQFTVNDLNFQPDLIIAKSTSNAEYWIWTDSVRGFTKSLKSNTTDAETTDATGVVTNVNGTGFQTTNNKFSTGRTYTTWCWKAGGAAVSNTDGTITSSVSANTSYGFSIVSYTGNGSSSASIGHGLNSTPEWVIVKRTDSANAWVIAHAGIGTNNLQFDTSAAYSPSTGSGGGGISLGNSTTISPVQGTSNINNSNASGGTYIAYCWSEIIGFSKFGTFTHSGSNSGVSGLGFKPRYVLIKRTDGGTDNWYLFDSSRNTNNALFPNTDGASNAGWAVTFNDSGFSWVAGSFNSGTYIYAAFADKPPGEIIDSLIDTPTDIEANSGNNPGNYCTLNPLKKANITTSNGNLDFTHSGSTGNWQVVFSTIGMSSGKYYCEFTCKDSDSIIGIAKDSHTIANDKYVGNDPNGWGYNGQNGTTFNNSSSSSYGSSYTSGDVIGIAFDANGGNLYFYKNGVVQNSGTAAYTGLTDGPYFFAFSLRDTGNTPSVNFGQRPFAISSIPTGYKSLCTSNLPDPTISDPSQYFDTKLYTGNASSNTISGLNLAPDFLWLKSRGSAQSHALFDLVRGSGQRLQSNATSAEDAYSSFFTGFTSDGFTLNQNSGINLNNDPLVAWAWDAGTSTVTNNDGSIASQVRAQPSAGFSIVAYTGTGSTATWGHGLNSAPELVIIKSRSDAQNWAVYSKHTSGAASPAEEYGFLNSTNAFSSSGAGFFWNNTLPTSSVVTVGSDNTVNGSSKTYVAYCFSPVAGYSAFGSYTGNGSADGPFVYTGMKPAFLLIKNSSLAGSNWIIIDTARDTFNEADNLLKPNSSNAEQITTANEVDILSNGFKPRGTDGDTNGNGNTLVYAAFAENPFKTARAR